MSPAEFRQACREYAMKFVDIQRAEFKRLGVLGDWDAPVPDARSDVRGRDRARAREVRARRLPVSRQEAGDLVPARQDGARRGRDRIQGQDLAVVYVRMPLRRSRQARRAARGQAARARDLDDDPVDAAREPRDRRASRLRRTSRCRTRATRASYLIVAKELAEAFAQGDRRRRSSAAIEITPVEMTTLEGARYQHPFVAHAASATDDFRLWFADYVTADAGTGLVHTAPGHGADDYKTGMAHGLPAYAPLDDCGPLHRGRRLERRRGRPGGQVDRRGQPDHRRAPRGDRVTCSTRRPTRSSTSTRTAGAARARSSTARRRSGSSRWITTSCARRRSPRSIARPGSRRGATIGSTR